MKQKSPEENNQQIGNLLSRYKDRLKPPQASVEKVFLEAVESITGLTIDKSRVRYNVAGRTISLQVSAMIKSELKTKQTELQKYLTEKLPKDRVPTVIF